MSTSNKYPQICKLIGLKVLKTYCNSNKTFHLLVEQGTAIGLNSGRFFGGFSGGFSQENPLVSMCMCLGVGKSGMTSDGEQSFGKDVRLSSQCTVIESGIITDDVSDLQVTSTDPACSALRHCVTICSTMHLGPVVPSTG